MFISRSSIIFNITCRVLTGFGACWHAARNTTPTRLSSVASVAVRWISLPQPGCCCWVDGWMERVHHGALSVPPMPFICRKRGQRPVTDSIQRRGLVDTLTWLAHRSVDTPLSSLHSSHLEAKSVVIAFGAQHTARHCTVIILTAASPLRSVPLRSGPVSYKFALKQPFEPSRPVSTTSGVD